MLEPGAPLQVDPKDHEEVVAEKNKLEKSLAESEKAKGVLETRQAELLRAKEAVEKQRDDSNTTRSKIAAQVFNTPRFFTGQVESG